MPGYDKSAPVTRAPLGKVQDHAEAVAVRLIEAVLVGTRMVKIEPEPPRTHDFDLLDSNGYISAAVEVTVSLDEATKRTNSRIRKIGPVKTKLCKNDWWVQTEPGADIRKIQCEVDERLAAIEADGIERFLFPIHWRKPSVERIFRDLRVYSGSVLRWKAPGYIRIDLRGGGGLVSGNFTVDAALREACKKDNREKLVSANTNQRHLVVYVDPTNYMPWKALVDSVPPSDSPQLPTEITDIWVFAKTAFEHEYITWHASALSPWRRIGPLVLPEPGES
jgi:hypothetical protein